MGAAVAVLQAAARVKSGCVDVWPGDAGSQQGGVLLDGWQAVQSWCAAYLLMASECAEWSCAEQPHFDGLHWAVSGRETVLDSSDREAVCLCAIV